MEAILLLVWNQLSYEGHTIPAFANMYVGRYLRCVWIARYTGVVGQRPRDETGGCGEGEGVGEDPYGRLAVMKEMVIVCLCKDSGDFDSSVKLMILPNVQNEAPSCSAGGVGVDFRPMLMFTVQSVPPELIARTDQPSWWLWSLLSHSCPECGCQIRCGRTSDLDIYEGVN